MSNICIINVYTGKLPDTYPLWLKSVKWNTSIDFLLVTDAEVDDVPANMRVIKMSLKDIKHLAEQELGMKIALDIPVKLCDYKPVYGVIFNQYLKGYDYWGSCDLDMIFGDLQKFFTKFELYKYDKFLHQGHLALYRNNSTINSAYKLPGSYYTYKRVFSSNESFVFDEYNRINSIFHHNKLPLFDKTIFANINPAFTKFKCCNLKNYNKQLFYYASGKVFRAFCDRKGKVHHQEFIYIHLLKRKLGTIPQEIIDADIIAITENGYFVLDRIPDTDIINAYTKDQSLAKDHIEALANFKHRWMTAESVKAQLTVAAWKIDPLRNLLVKRKS